MRKKYSEYLQGRIDKAFYKFKLLKDHETNSN